MGFEIIDIRRFEARDFARLLEAESRAWNNRLRWDFGASARIINSCLRDQRLSGYALVNDGKIHGYCFFFYDGDKGIIGDLYVHPELAGLGHEQNLLNHAVETLLGTPGLNRIEAQLPHYEQEDLSSCFVQRGFKPYLRRFMSLPLDRRTWTPTAARSATANDKAWVREGIELTSWDQRLNESAAELLYQAYRHHVDADINDQYSSVTGAMRLVENIFHNQGCGDFLSRVSRMAVYNPTRRLAGILSVTAVRPRTAHIPQVAVGPSFQGLGVGTALMEAAFRDLARDGFEEVTLTVTDANSGAVRLYENLGFETFKTFGAFIYTRE